MATILVVDDEPSVRSMLVAVLEEEGYAVMSAADGPRALDVAAQVPLDLVLLDIMLPGMNGREVCRRLVELPGGRKTPVILMSAAARPTAQDQEIAGFLAKPFDIDKLLAAVERVLAGERLSTLPAL